MVKPVRTPRTNYRHDRRRRKMTNPIDDENDPETAAMLAGAEIEKGADAGVGAPHQDDSEPVLTTDVDAQKQDSVISPDTA
jgi:hypothetical protein